MKNRKLFVQLAISLSFIFVLFVFQNGTCAQLQEYVTTVTQGQGGVADVTPSPSPAGSCQCPANYYPLPDNSKCQRVEQTAMLTFNPPLNYVKNIVRGDQRADQIRSAAIRRGPAAVGTPPPAGTLNFQFNFTSYNWFQTSDLYAPTDSMTTIPASDIINSGATYNFLKSRLTNGQDVTGGSPVSIKPDGGLRLDGYQGAAKYFCVEVPQTKKYLIHIGGSGDWLVLLDKWLFANCRLDRIGCESTSYFIEQTLPAGRHEFGFEFTNKTIDIGSPQYQAWNMAWLEVLDNTEAELRTATQESHLRKVFSTADIQANETWDRVGNGAAQFCPMNFVYDACALPTPGCFRKTIASCL